MNNVRKMLDRAKAISCCLCKIVDLKRPDWRMTCLNLMLEFAMGRQSMACVIP